MSSDFSITLATADDLAHPPKALIDAIRRAKSAGRKVHVEVTELGLGMDYEPDELALQVGVDISDVEGLDTSRREAAEVAVTERALRIQEKPTKAKRLVSIGRHPKSDLLTAVYAVRSGHEVEYVTPSGDVRKRSL